mgnify:CR=1 FL=1
MSSVGELLSSYNWTTNPPCLIKEIPVPQPSNQLMTCFSMTTYLPCLNNVVTVARTLYLNPVIS